MKRTHIMLILFLFYLGMAPPPVSCDDNETAAGNLLQYWLEPISRQTAGLPVDPRSNPLAALARFYHQREFRPAWIHADGLLPDALTLFQIIDHAPENGLETSDYDFRNIATAPDYLADYPGMSPGAFDYHLIRLDMALTEMLLKYCVHLSRGRIRPETIFETDQMPDKASIGNLPEKLAEALDQGHLALFLDNLSPRHAQYLSLKKILKDYRRLEAAGGWPRIPGGTTLKPGDLDPRVAVLRRALSIMGDLRTDSAGDEDYFGPDIEAAVTHFQQRHGLQTDGVAGKQTLEVLNTPVTKRITQVLLNMERWRWFPENLGSRYVMVNIPGYELRLVEDENVLLSMRVVVGQKSRQTPVLSAQMTYLELNPYWNIPQKIARKDLLPKIQGDPGYLNRQGIQVFDSWLENASELDPMEIDWARFSESYFPFRLRQEPASNNALGRVKFMFPNTQSIYIHDTPGKSLFNRSQRLFSSGCVRVEDPLMLATHLLKDQHWSGPLLKRAIDSGRSRTVLLDAPVPVHLVYFTAWTDAEGQINFREDVYGRDRDLQLALSKENSKI